MQREKKEEEQQKNTRSEECKLYLTAYTSSYAKNITYTKIILLLLLLVLLLARPSFWMHVWLSGRRHLQLINDEP